MFSRILVTGLVIAAASCGAARTIAEPPTGSAGATLAAWVDDAELEARFPELHRMLSGGLADAELGPIADVAEVADVADVGSLGYLGY